MTNQPRPIQQRGERWDWFHLRLLAWIAANPIQNRRDLERDRHGR